MKANKHGARMSNDTRTGVLETTIININTTLLDIKHDMNRRFDVIDRKFEVVDHKFDDLEKKMDKKFDLLQDRLWSNFLWLMGMIIGLSGLIAHTQHWI